MVYQVLLNRSYHQKFFVLLFFSRRISPFRGAFAIMRTAQFPPLRRRVLRKLGEKRLGIKRVTVTQIMTN